MAAVVLDRLSELQRLDEAVLALAHQLVVGARLDAFRREIDERGEDVGRAVEERTGKHRSAHALAPRIRLPLVGGAGRVQPVAGGVDPQLGVVEKPAGELVDELLLFGEGLPGRVVVPDPVPVVVDAILVPDPAARAIGGLSLE